MELGNYFYNEEIGYIEVIDINNDLITVRCKSNNKEYALSKENMFAEYLLAEAYTYGKENDEDACEAAIPYYEIAMKKGVVLARYQLANCYLATNQNLEKARDLFEKCPPQESLTKLLKIQNELKAPKNQYNSYGGFKYRSCEDILESLKPLLKEEELILRLTDELVNIGDRYYVKATAILTDGDKTIPLSANFKILSNLASRSYL